MRTVSLLLLATCAVLLSDVPVSGADDKLATVEGKVTYKGQPLADGTITFYLKDDQFVGAKIKEDGTYRIDRVPAGKVKVVVQSRKVPIPEKYAHEETTPLEIEIKKGKAAIDIEVSD
jgi:hypothetical protein